MAMFGSDYKEGPGPEYYAGKNKEAEQQSEIEKIKAQFQEACEHLAAAFCPPNYAVAICNKPTKEMCTACWMKFISTPKDERGTNG